MLTSSKQLILEAQKGGYAIGSFNTSNLEITKAIIAAAEKLKSPVIIGTSEKAIAYAGLDQIAAIIRAEAEKASVPVAIHLDHGKTLDMVLKCLNAGYTSVMYDGSHLSYEENKILTRQAVSMAHRANVPCEGELGAVGRSTDKIKQLTNPVEAIEFLKETKVDFLAISIGSGHGVGGNENLDIDLLKKIRRKINVPLVLHGGSGVPEKDIRLAIKNGICKINIDTDIRQCFIASVNEITKHKNPPDDPRDLMIEVMLDVQKIIEDKINLFGSAGKVK